MLEREGRREVTARDVAILTEAGPTPYPDLDGLAEYVARTPMTDLD